MIAVIGAFTGGYIVGRLENPARPPRTCESAQAQMLALEQCLKFRPLCSSVTVDDFAEYRDNKNWRREHCAYSGDGFQSQ
jgi:hypothetical protein